jgi:glycosyltransferase involved in cell wall biosynthesis
LRILNIIQCANLGGMEQASLRLMQALQRRGHHLALISLHPLGPLAPQLQASGIEALGLGYGQLPFWRWLHRLRCELRRQAPDALLLTGHSLPVLLAITGCCRGHRLLAIHFHHTGVKPGWFWRLYYGLARRMLNAVTFPSDVVRREAVALCPDLAGKAHTLRNPMAPVEPISASERRAARQRFALPADGPIVGNAGWLIARKRFDVFLRTAAALRQQRPDARFLIAGDGPERPRLESLAASLGIADAVIWAGWVERMRDVYAALDLLLFNTDWDALPTTPIEATVHGVPVVCSVLRGGLAELLRPGVDAVLLEQHDVQALAAAALRLLDDPPASAAMAGRARAHVLALSDPERLAAWHERALQGF